MVWFRKTDAVLMVALISAALLWLCWQSMRATDENSCVYVVFVDGVEAASGLVPMEEGTGGMTEFSLPERPNVVFRIDADGVAFVQSDCPDHICIQTGALRQAGQTAACVPNKMVLQIRGVNARDDVDAAVYHDVRGFSCAS